MSRRIVVSARVVDAQRRAADPLQSAWVSANAGSGKTHVLTERVLRLLLSGAAPESILCLTYTKAAAAVMRARIAARLGAWALLDEAALAADLAQLTGREVSAEARRRARTLFAHALDTPGGLKILTIHAFCESVLHRFPLEAGVPVDFAVLEETERDDLILMVREEVIAAGLAGGGPVAQAVETLFALLSDHQIASAINCALMEARKLRPLLADRDGAKARLRKLTGFSGPGLAEITDLIANGYTLGRADHDRVTGLIPDSAFAQKLAEIDPDFPDADLLCAAFLTQKGRVPQNFPPKDIRTGDAALAEKLSKEAFRLQELCATRQLAGLIERSEALIDLLGAIFDGYEDKKRARALLDFDDLIDRARELFSDRRVGDWVRYKLDAGITHMLVDESQDTNPEQWQVIDALVSEFFAGAGAVSIHRTVFGVGDEKQSIYSFQGAEPALFGRYGRHYRQRAAAAGLRFEQVKLGTSFRTLKGILDAVDLVFSADPIKAAVLAGETELTPHETARADDGGMVTLWPPIQQKQEETDSGWLASAEPADFRSAERQVAEKIAGAIYAWVASGRPLGPRGRPVRYDDVLILVQSRGALFFETIRALGAFGIPSPGADRLAVSSHIAVLDLMALGDVLINTAEDLQLAALLRSPLFDIDEEMLMAIAAGRPEKSSLWRALGESEFEPARVAFDKLRTWRNTLDFDRPYEFYAHILYAEGGLRRFHGRLGPEVDDVFSEFLALALAHEQSEQPSLQGFLAELRMRHVAIRRELPEEGGGVRVMTVHGAKGLEAPIVILADAATTPSASQIAKPVVIADLGGEPVLVHGNKDQHVEATLALRQKQEEAERQEYWRKLYVGMTRAEDELYVTGPLTPGTDAKKQLAGSWYEAIRLAIETQSRIETDAEGKPVAIVYPAEARAGKAEAREAAAPDTAPLVLPPLPEVRPVETIRPSSAQPHAEEETALDRAARAVIDAQAARREGIALHALLQHLGRVPPVDRALVGPRAMAVLLPESPDRHAALVAKAESILTAPALAHLFGPDSRAEVPFLAEGTREGRPVRIAGRIDRLVVRPQEVLIVDFKSDAAPPSRPDGIPGSYRTQLALYALVASRLFPDKIIRPAILWTVLESLMFLPEEMLAEAVEGFTLR